MQRVESMPSHRSWKWAYTKVKLHNSQFPLIDPPSNLFCGWFLTVWFVFIFSVLVKWKQSIEERRRAQFLYRCIFFDQRNENSLWLGHSHPAGCPADSVRNVWVSTDTFSNISGYNSSRTMWKWTCVHHSVDVFLCVPHRVWLAVLEHTEGRPTDSVQHE